MRWTMKVRPSSEVVGNRRAIAFMLSVLNAVVFIPAIAQSAEPTKTALYEVVRGKQLSICRDLANNLNRFRDEPPQVCFRKIHPAVKDLRLPNWRELPRAEAIAAADAAITTIVSGQVEKAAMAGKLRVWEAHLDFAGSGEQVRVVLVSMGECDPANNASNTDPTIAVLRPSEFEIDKRFASVSRIDGDIVIYNDRAYVATWRAHPSAEGSGDPGPRRRHQGYLLISEVGWLKYGFGASQEGGEAGLGGTACQIGYNRLNATKGAVK